MERSTLLTTNAGSLSVATFADQATHAPTGLPGRFGLHYQPEVDLGTETIVACEALLRWWHPDFGMLRPGASLWRSRWESNLVELDQWAIHAACHQGAVWTDQGRPLQIAVNATRDHVVSEGFPNLVREALASSGLDPRYLGIDVPLSALALHPAATRDALLELSALGIGVFIDGVHGDGPEGMLDGVSVDAVKIPLHRNGRRRPGLHRTVIAALELTRAAGATSVAKAVETVDELEAVRDVGFDRAFGHVYSPPVAAAALHHAIPQPAGTPAG